MKEKKNEELYNACTRSVLKMGNLPTFMVGDLHRNPSGNIETAHDGTDSTLAV